MTVQANALYFMIRVVGTSELGYSRSIVLICIHRISEMLMRLMFW